MPSEPQVQSVAEHIPTGLVSANRVDSFSLGLRNLPAERHGAFTFNERLASRSGSKPAVFWFG